MTEKAPLSYAESEALYDEYVKAGAPGPWLAWLGDRAELIHPAWGVA